MPLRDWMWQTLKMRLAGMTTYVLENWSMHGRVLVGYGVDNILR